MNPYRILKTDNGYEIVRVSYDEDMKPVLCGPLDHVFCETLEELSLELVEVWAADMDPPLTYADFKREG